MKQRSAGCAENSEILKPAAVLVQEINFLVEFHHGGIRSIKSHTREHLLFGPDFHRSGRKKQFGGVVQNLGVQAAGEQNQKKKKAIFQCFFQVPARKLPQEKSCFGWVRRKPFRVVGQGKQVYGSLFPGR